MAKKQSPLKAKQAKQKKIAIGLVIALVLVLAYQGPKTLKMLKGPGGAAVATDGSDPTALPAGVEAPAGTPAPTTATPAAGAPTAPATVPATGAAPTGAEPQPGVLANSDVPVAAGVGQLLSFEQFVTKDPFKQQVDSKAVAAAAGTDATAGDGKSAPADPAAPGSDPVSPGTDPSIPGSAENPPLSVGGVGSGTGSTGSTGSGTSGSPSAPTKPAATPAAATTISINGTVETVTVDAPFPVAQPTFTLVSTAENGKSVQIGVVGGSLAGGGATVKLTVGKPITLQNTADGSRFKLVLLTVAGAVPPASKG
jgi:hypothetical protein